MGKFLEWLKSSAIIRQQVSLIVVTVLTILGVKLDFDLSAQVEKIAAEIGVLAALLVPVWTIITRVRKPAPNLSATAKAKEKELVEKGDLPDNLATHEVVQEIKADRAREGGFARVGLLAALAIGAIATAMFVGCTGTAAAYKAAEDPAEYAFVIVKHYESLVNQAADLKDRPTTSAQAVAAMQKADSAAGPVIEKLRGLRDAYLAVHSASSEAELQAAINQAVSVVADFIRAVSSANGGKVNLLEQRILDHDLALRRAA